MGHWLDTWGNGRLGDPTPGFGPLAPQPAATSIPGMDQIYNPVPANTGPLAPMLPIDYKALNTQPKNITTTAKALAVMKAAKQDHTQNYNAPLVLTGVSKQVYEALQGAGFGLPVLNFAWLLCYMESGAWANSFMRKDNNPGNIVYVKQAGATKGGYMAANSTPTKKYYAAHFKTLAAFAKDLYRVMSHAPGYPLQATTLGDFAHRLKLNDYYGSESEESYLAKLQRTAQRLRIIADLKQDTDQKITTPGAGNWFKDHPFLAGGVVVLSAIIIIKAVN